MYAVACAHGIGGLKATAHALAIESVLQAERVPVLFRTGASGGALAAAAMSHSRVHDNGIGWLLSRIAGINEDKLYDTDWEQQLIDRARKWARLPKRKGDRPLLGWYRGNGLHRALGELVADLGHVRSPFAVVSCSLNPETMRDPNMAPLVAMNAQSGLGQKKVRWFDTGTTGLTHQKRLTDALRASTAIPFVLRPHMIDGVYEVDGGVLSLTTEEVAADKFDDEFDPPKNGRAYKFALVISDMQTLPSVEDGVADDMIELGLMLMISVGSHIQALNTAYTMRKLEPLDVGIWRITAPASTDINARQFQTSAVLDLFDEYRSQAASDQRIIDLLKWLKS